MMTNRRTPRPFDFSAERSQIDQISFDESWTILGRDGGLWMW